MPRLPRSASSLLAVVLLGAAGCNSYEVFRVTGFEQAGFNNNADILFIIDNSPSMQQESSDLAVNFETFIGKLTSTDGGNVPRATLTDAVESYLRETSGESLYIDYQLGLTTSSVDYSEGADGGIELGEAGLLTGHVVARDAEAPADDFRQQLLCQATCWNEVDLLSDPAFVCGESELGDQVSREYLDCVCGVDEWRDHCGAGNEEGLEAALMAVCRATPEPPELCFEYVPPDGSTTPNPTVLVQGEDEGSNDGLLRENATTVVVIVTDEGDGSRRIANGDSEVEPYLDAFAEFENPVRFAVIGPPWRDSNGDCLDGALPYAVERYQNMAAETFGMYVDLTNLDEGCAATDFASNLEQIGTLLSNLVTMFPLQAIPDVATIRVWIDGDEIPEAPVTSGTVAAGDAVYGDGWFYEAASNAVRFNGAAIPEYNADVRIYYRPLGGMPRELPF